MVIAHLHNKVQDLIQKANKHDEGILMLLLLLLVLWILIQVFPMPQRNNEEVHPWWGLSSDL
jgi:hypothetical protein